MAHFQEFLGALAQHLRLVGVALGIGIAVCVPLGVWTSRSQLAAATVINAFNGVRVIPSLAILFLAIPYFGLTFTAAALALTVLALPPILINTDIAFRTIDPAIKEAAFGMGMSRRQVLRQLETPLAVPAILTGIKTAAIEVVASVTLAAFIGAGGLGTLLFDGIAEGRYDKIWAGAIAVSALALIFNWLLRLLEREFDPQRYSQRLT